MRGYSQYIIKRYGTFTEPAFVSVGDPYVAPGTAAQRFPSRFNRSQVISSPSRKGQNYDVMLQKNYVPLVVGDKFTDEFKIQQRLEMDKKRKNLSPQPFRPVSPNKKNSTPGDNYGLLSKQQFLLEEDTQTALDRTAATLDKTSKTVSSKMTKGSNISQSKPVPFRPVSPAKQGGPGYIGTRIGGTEYPYISDQSIALLSNSSTKNSVDYKTKTRSFSPTQAFKSTSAGNKLFDEHYYYSFTPNNTGKQKRNLSSTPGTDVNSSFHKLTQIPFVSQSHTKHDISPYPSHDPEPFIDKFDLDKIRGPPAQPRRSPTPEQIFTRDHSPKPRPFIPSGVSNKTLPGYPLAQI
ncbi:MAG: hypothetical protein EZS28_008377 [Streblomastix strix]|uniref:Cilia-and flagella-associated protein 96 n=1 Tax=Streblomastix strix TaxID=222440 RepID=A0A5J4WNV0_9EUKA|nr:MAG: hypothetical protein EZS28_008377 [Streblomastix strix]